MGIFKKVQSLDLGYECFYSIFSSDEVALSSKSKKTGEKSAVPSNSTTLLVVRVFL